MNKSFYGPLWVMPKFTGAGGGLGFGTTIIGADTQETSEYYQAVGRGLIISAPSANSGDIYLVQRAADGTFKASNAGTVVAVIAKGTTFQLPQAEYGSNRYKFADYGIDAASGDIAYPVGIMQ